MGLLIYSFILCGLIFISFLWMLYILINAIHESAETEQ